MMASDERERNKEGEKGEKEYILDTKKPQQCWRLCQEECSW